ncbi:unnamed protein product [Lactuca virosa]|uniref:RPW8 domain-containing protein n=1 Tax=Lactuca virosa TaxID=75947 RepID=A0AAU9P122_9ASTR|nr:unnamed protein product [Lactuca virosa]
MLTETTAEFKPQLEELRATLQRITPIIEETVKLKRELDHSELECKMFIDEVQKAEELITRCSKVKRDPTKMFLYSRELKNFKIKLVNFFQVGVQAIQIRDIMQTLAVVNDIKSKLDRMYVDSRDSKHRTRLVGSHSGSESVERKKYGWQVPGLQSGIVAFDEPLEKLKAEVVSDIGVDDRLVLVVEAPGGCGKTTLVKMLCHDAEIRENFGENIFYVTVSETPDLMVIVSDLFNPNPSTPQLQFQGKEDAKIKLDNFLNKKASDPMLLVLDDVWSASFIEELFPSKIRGHKILVTSRTAFPKYKTFRFEPLNEEDAKTLFCDSAFTKGGSRPSPTISDHLVNQKHPLTLLVVGRSLNGKNDLAWKSMLGKLSQEDQRIPVSTLLNMWVHLYNHDDDGVDTMDTILELSYRNLVDLMAKGFGNDLGATVTFCDQQFVTQHDLMKELAIHLNNKLPLAQRSRLFIDARGEDLPASIVKIQEAMQARILSISTGESFSSRWCDMKVPDLEVLILNLMSKTYTLPHFLAANPKLKILNITNNRLYPTEFSNFDFLGASYNLTRIRLERVVISPSILSLINLQKVSFIMCNIGDPFKNLITNTPNIWPQLVELEIDYCQDLVKFPGTLCNSVHLKKISITNCNEMRGFSEEFGDLINLEMFGLRSCMKLKKLPESIWRLKNLSVLDISDCTFVTDS